MRWRRPPTACKQVVSGSLSLPAQGCFSPVPHGTRSLSVTRESLALEGGPPGFTPDPTCRALLRKSTTESTLSSRTGLSPSLAPHSRGLRLTSLSAYVAPTTPTPRGGRFGLGPVRSPLLRASQLLSLPLGTEMFQFPRFASRLRGMTALARRRVSPFGHPGINACVPLPLAYRSLPRPSSPPCAQAFPTCFRSLDYKVVVSQSTRVSITSDDGLLSSDSMMIRIPRSTPLRLSNSVIQSVLQSVLQSAAS